MKIESSKQEFTPIILTIETQEELDWFTTVLNNVGGSATVRIFGNTSTVPYKLMDIGGNLGKFSASKFNGTGLYIEDTEE